MSHIPSRATKDEVDLLLEQSKYLALPVTQRNPYVSCTTSDVARKTKTQSSDVGVSHFDYLLSNAEIKEHTHSASMLPGDTKRIRQDFDFPKATHRQVDISPKGRKSIFALEMERKLRNQLIDPASVASDSAAATRTEQIEGLNYLLKAGPKVITGTGLGFRRSEVTRIHQENIDRLSEMPEEEILRERELLLSTLDPSTISFLLHKDRRVTVMSDEATVKAKPGSDSQTLTVSDPSKYPLPPNPNIPHMNDLEADKLEWTLELPEVAKTAPSVHTVPRSGTSSDNDAVDEMFNPLQDVSDETTVSHNTKPCQARFDLSGLLVPPDAVVDTHLGLHHHGDEPERAGYTVGELFHLSRSSVPAQRRLALAALSSSLIASRRGLHVPSLAPPSSPSLIHGLLSSTADSSTENGRVGGGVIFLLRWCLDESVAAVTRVGSVAAGVRRSDVVNTGIAGGASLCLTVECIRCLANLLSDSFGEAFLSNSFDWAVRMTTFNQLFISPNDKKFAIFASQPQDGSDPPEDVDHSKAASRDPVHFLFTHSHLGQRLCWLLSDAHGGTKLKLSADAVGIWLPALLLRAVRHSSELAYRVFIIPNLFKTLTSHFLPICFVKESSNGSSPSSLCADRPDELAESSGIPLPAILQLCRITFETNGSIRLAMVNDLEIIERCISYLVPSNLFPHVTDSDATTVQALIAHLPRCLPQKLALKLQIESLHCLSSCLSHTRGNVSSIPNHAVTLLWNSFPSLLMAYQMAWTVYSRTFVTAVSKRSLVSISNSELLLLQLFSSWNRFVCNALGVFAVLPSYLPCNPVKNWSPDHILSWLHQVLRPLCASLSHIQQLFQSHSESLKDTEVRLTQAGVTPTVLSVAVDSIIQLYVAYNQLVTLPKSIHVLKWTDMYNVHILPLFSHELLLRQLQHFIRYGSILTGHPDTLHDVDVVMIPPLSDPVSGVPQELHIESIRKPCIIWDEMPMDTRIDSSLLTPVNLSAQCLPDWGGRVCFRYHSPGGNLACLFWPRTGFNVEDESDTLSYNAANPHLLPLLSTIVSLLEVLLFDWHVHLVCTVPEKLLSPVVDWVIRLALRRPLPWLRNSEDAPNVVPPVLVAFEAELLGRAVLLLARLVTQQCPLSSTLVQQLCLHARGNLLYIAALRLLPLLRGGQLWLVDLLLNDILSSPVQLNFVLQRDFSVNLFPDDQLITHLRNAVQMYRKHIASDHSDGNVSLPRRANESPITTGSSEQSTSVNFPSSRSTQSLAVTVVSRDWAYLPIIHHYEAYNRRTTSANCDADKEICLEELTGNLYWLLLLAILQPTELQRSDPVGLLDPLSHLAHLCIGWLSYSGAGSLGFGRVGQMSAKLLHSIGPIATLQQRTTGDYSLEHLECLPRSCTSFYDIYVNLLEHYAALSYSAPVFSNLILWPCQQLCHVKYRRALWGEHRNALISIRLRLDQLFLPIRSFLEPEETDESVLRTYASALFSGGVRKDKNPVLFLIAVHHLNRCLYRQTNASTIVGLQINGLLRAMRQPDNSPIYSKNIQLDELLDVLCRYKQPDAKWTGQNPRLLSYDKLCVGVHDRMVMLNDEDVQKEIETDDSTELLPETGMQLYSSSELPVHRKSYWEKTFS